MLQMQSQESKERLKTMSSRLSRNGGHAEAAPSRGMAHGPGTRSIENMLYEPDEIIRQTELKQRPQGHYQKQSQKPHKTSALLRSVGVVDRDGEQQTITLRQADPRRVGTKQ